MIKNFLQECDYEHGYFKALLDVQNWINQHSISMKQNKCFNEKRIKQLISCFIENREKFMEKGEDLGLTVTKDSIKMN